MGYVEDYQKHCTRQLAWYREHFVEAAAESVSGCRLRYAFQHRPGSKNAIIIVSGRAEFIEKYIELAGDLQDMDSSLCLYDHCGQGGSGRLLSDPLKGHIDHFQTYIDDLASIIGQIRSRYHVSSIHLLSHSMGATISALYAARHPEIVSKVVLGSPMFAVHTGFALPGFMVRLIVAAAVKLGAAECYVARRGAAGLDQAFEGNVWTTDRERFESNRALTVSLDYAYLGEPTFGWVHQAYQAMQRVKMESPRFAGPVLLMAALQDRVVGLKEMKHFAESSSHCTYLEYKGARHELYMERDEVRDAVIAQIKCFMRG